MGGENLQEGINEDGLGAGSVKIERNPEASVNAHRVACRGKTKVVPRARRPFRAFFFSQQEAEYGK